MRRRTTHALETERLGRAISKLSEGLRAKDLVSSAAMRVTGVRTSSCAKRLPERLVRKLAAPANENDAQAFGHLDQDERAFLPATLKGIVDRLGIRGAAVD